jgi:hypothetical protein
MDSHTYERISRELYRAIDYMASAELGTDLDARARARELRRARDAAQRAMVALTVAADLAAAALVEDDEEPEENPSALPGDKDYSPIVHELSAWLRTTEGSPND